MGAFQKRSWSDRCWWWCCHTLYGWLRSTDVGTACSQDKIWKRRHHPRCKLQREQIFGSHADARYLAAMVWIHDAALPEGDGLKALGKFSSCQPGVCQCIHRTSHPVLAATLTNLSTWQTASAARSSTATWVHALHAHACHPSRTHAPPWPLQPARGAAARLVDVSGGSGGPARVQEDA